MVYTSRLVGKTVYMPIICILRYGLDKEMVELKAKVAKRTLEKKDIKICMKYIQSFFT